MEPFIIFCIIIILLTIKLLLSKNIRTNKATAGYKYAAKNCIVTQTELRFYEKLREIIDDKYTIVPQAHLSSFLRYDIPGQNYRAAFMKINGKSVDFLVCTKDTLMPIVAIEIDDNSHLSQERKIRDAFVNEIISNSGIRLVRFKAGEWLTENQIKQKVPELS